MANYGDILNTIYLYSHSIRGSTVLATIPCLRRRTRYECDQSDLYGMPNAHAYRVAQKSKPQTFVHIFAKYWTILKIFYWRILWKMCNKVVTKHTTTP